VENKMFLVFCLLSGGYLYFCILMALQGEPANAAQLLMGLIALVVPSPLQVRGRGDRPD
jgi:hypothetical protein